MVKVNIIISTIVGIGIGLIFYILYYYYPKKKIYQKGEKMVSRYSVYTVELDKSILVPNYSDDEDMIQLMLIGNKPKNFGRREK